MTSTRVKALAAGIAAEMIREAIPTKHDLIDAELYRPEDWSSVVQELERLANELLAESHRLDAL